MGKIVISWDEKVGREIKWEIARLLSAPSDQDSDPPSLHVVSFFGTALLSYFSKFMHLKFVHLKFTHLKFIHLKF